MSVQFGLVVIRKVYALLLSYQKKAARVIFDANDQASSVTLFNSLQWLPSQKVVKIAKCCVTYKRIKGVFSFYIEDYL